MDHYQLSKLNCFAGYAIDRVSGRRTDEKWLSERLKDPSSFFIPVWEAKNLVKLGETPRPILLEASHAAEFVEKAESISFLGEEDGKVYFGVGLSADASSLATALGKLGEFKDLRGVGLLLHRREGALLAYARAMAYWHQRHRFCGDCGCQTKSAEGGHLRVCTNPQCAQQHFPRTDPAIIVLVAKKEHCLLARQSSWAKGFYSTLAGFVEPGETLEEAVVREVMEETGIRVRRVYYHSSQPWPFPCSIMLGFIAEAENEDIFMNRDELEDVRWFSREDIKREQDAGTLRLPPKVSVAHFLIEHWFDKQGESFAAF